jgi:hypothetical protein
MNGQVLVVSVLVWSLWSPIGAAQRSAAEVEREQAERDAQQHQSLLVAFRHGDAAAIDSLLAMDRKRVTSLVFHGIGGFHPWDPEPFKLAVMLHTATALQLSDRMDGDGVFLHLDLASQILDKGAHRLKEFGGPGGPELNVFGGRWYLTVSRWLRVRHSVTSAERFLKLGLELLPHDPFVLYESATVAETLATLYATQDSVSTNVKHRLGRLNDAARWLQETLDKDSTNVMARLHLGRVQTLRGNERDGIKHLQQVLNATSDDATAYLAAIFIGAAYERDKRLEEAADSYRQANARFSRGHAAPLALSAVLQRSGHGDESRSILLGLVMEASGTIRDPWWWYLYEPPGVADERMALLRAEVVR